MGQSVEKNNSLLPRFLRNVYGLLYIWFESFPIVFVQIYGFNLGQLGLAFLGILVGAFLVIPPYYWWMYKYVEPRFDEGGNISPEARLPPACVGGFFIPVCLFWFGWASSTLAFISIVFIPISWVLMKYGGMLRKKYSRHSRKDI
ncbi:resistance protein [Aspergillus sp. HF37]|nr:resistance protein [Aspergillus sp. HF37]